VSTLLAPFLFFGGGFGFPFLVLVFFLRFFFVLFFLGANPNNFIKKLPLSARKPMLMPPFG